MKRRLQRRSELLAFLDQLLVTVANGTDGNDIFTHHVAGLFEGTNPTGQDRVIHSVYEVNSLIPVCRNELGSTFVSVCLAKSLANIANDGQLEPAIASLKALIDSPYPP